LANWILRHRLIVGALFAVVIVFSLVGAKRIVIRTSFDDYFLSNDPMLLKTNEFNPSLTGKIIFHKFSRYFV